jgi:glycosyltransferase involved in cell wall biosynthesis
MKLAIISHTPHYKRDGEIVGWGPTIREIDHLTEIFDKIYHLAPIHDEDAPESSLAYSKKEIEFVPLRKYGGEKISDKISVLTTAPKNLSIISKYLAKVDWAQFRAPTAMGLYVLPYLALRGMPRRWVKYAGNWKMDGPPLSYAIQKWILEKNFLKCKVTINGWWEGQKQHILSFPNPCLDDEELKKANEIGRSKSFKDKLKLCFVGTLTENKGSGLILEALELMSDKGKIDEIVFAGGGALLESHRQYAEKMDVKVSLPGFMSRNELANVYETSHLIILPSSSEGFPKVIAEAAAYGCVPIVSDVSSISQYFDNRAAFLLKDITANGVREKLTEAIADREGLSNRSQECMKLAENYTFSHYIRLLQDGILNVKD